MSMHLRQKVLEAKTKPKTREAVLKLADPLVYSRPGEPGFRTKQEFKDDCDINRLLARAQREGTLTHITEFGGEYGDFSEIGSLLDAHLQYQRGVEIFDRLPAEMRKEFNQNPVEFFQYVNDPANRDDLVKKLPAIAMPGRFFPDVGPQSPPDALKGMKPNDHPAPVVKPRSAAPAPAPAEPAPTPAPSSST